MELRDIEKLILMMLAEIHEHLKIKIRRSLLRTSASIVNAFCSLSSFTCWVYDFPVVSIRRWR